MMGTAPGQRLDRQRDMQTVAAGNAAVTLKDGLSGWIIHGRDTHKIQQLNLSGYFYPANIIRVNLCRCEVFSTNVHSSVLSVQNTSARVNPAHNRSPPAHTRMQFRQHRANRSPLRLRRRQPRPMEKTHE